MIRKNVIFDGIICDWKFDFDKAEGSLIWDKSGKRYIDFTSGWNVTNLGWNHSEITEAIIEQAKKTTYNPMWTISDIQERLASALTSALPKELNAICRATGGTEANEEALKVARVYTGRKKIIGFKNSYHGQSFGTMSLGYLPEYVEKISPLVGDFIQIDFPNINMSEKTPDQLLGEFSQNLEAVLARGDVAAIVSEAGIVTGWGNTAIAPTGFERVVRELTQKYNVLWILDEVGTGFSRCGRLFGMEMENVVPDIATFAKGFSNGAAPIGAMVTKTEIMEKSFDDANLTSTFGWTPIACAAALKSLEIHQRDKVWEKAERNGEYIIQKLNQRLQNPIVKSVHGKGMEIGIFLDINSVQKIVDSSLEKGLQITWDGEQHLVVAPPLTIPQEILDEGLEILISTINEINE